jgi:iron(III) transport system ATP-binding protein
MTKLRLIDVVKQFGAEAGAVVRGLNVAVEENQMLVLLGPSGCGKTTTLRMVAGLLNPDQGTIEVDGQTVAGPGWGWPPERRNLSMVFQSYAVWPHKTVFENVAYGLEVRRVGRDAIRQRVQAALDLVRLGGLGARYPSEISGGQQQRVALARAIVIEPSLLLLDEPLSNLDATLREQMRVELKSLQRQLGVASIYVTHDQAEAMVLADNLVVMRDGIIEQQGRAENVYRRPLSKFVADFLGVTNLLEGRLLDTGPATGRVEVAGLGIVQAHLTDEARKRVAVGQTVGVSIRPIDATISRIRPDDATNSFEGRVLQRIFLGDLTEYFVQTNNIRWRAHALSSQDMTMDDTIWVRFNPVAGTIVQWS